MLAGPISTTSRVIAVHTVTLTACLVLCLGAATWASSQSVMLTVQVTGAVILLITSLGLLMRLLRVSGLLERRLTEFARSTGDPFAMREIALASPPAADWNQLVQLGRRWQTFRSLEEHVIGQLGKQSGGEEVAILDALPDGIGVTDSVGNIVFANMALAAICGRETAKELCGRQIASALPTSTSGLELLQADFAGAKSFDLQIRTANGEARLLRWQRRIKRTSNGERAGTIWIVRDITQQKLAEEMRDQFLATATHELRTPLANIHAYAESLSVADDIDAESQKRFYNVIQSEAMRLTRLINDLLDVSRMQAGSLSLDSHECDVARLVDEVTSKVRGQAAEKQIELRIDISPKLPKLIADKSKLTAALVNLLGNAVKYTPAGGRVGFAVDANEQRLEFKVDDSGIGIAADELSKVFDKFFRSTDDRVRDIPGSGLGLAFTQEVARLHGGDVSVESELNRGSTFRLSLPLPQNG